MLKVVIVDDEQILRDGMKTIIDWEKYGFSIVGEADSGISGISVIREKKPDLVLADVKMPEMSGIEMITALKEENIKAKFIILSGYSDFAYTKKAILLGVDAYLLKPLDEDELIQLLIGIREKIKEESILEGYFEKGRQFVLKDLIRKMIEGTYENKESLYDPSEIEAYIGSPDYSVAIFSTNSAGGRMINEQILDFLHERKIFAYENSEVVAVLSLEENQTARGRLESLAMQLECVNGIHAFVTAGSRVKGSDMLNASYQEAKELMLNKFLFSHLCVVSIDDLPQEKGNADKQTGEIKAILEKITLSAQVLDKAGIADGTEKLKDIFCGRFYSESEIKSCCTNLLVSLLNKVSAQEIGTEYVGREDILQKIYSIESLDGLMKYVEDQLNRLADVLSDAAADSAIKRVEHYVKKNYNSRLTLDILGAMFGYSSVYLGKIFKQYTGLSFNQYLDNLRITEAKKLLSGDMKVYQIAEKVGFKSNDYFCSKFKRSEGMSPMEYKKKLENQADSS